MPSKALSAVFILLLLACLALPVLAWTVEDCVEVDYDHPDCDQYPTTTTSQGSTTTTEQASTTTEPEVTTTTEAEVTTTQPNGTTTRRQETTTTTAPCAEGFVHQPPLCVSSEVGTSSTEVEVSSTVVSAVVLDSLPFTGASSSILALASSLLLTAGLGLLAFRRRAA